MRDSKNKCRYAYARKGKERFYTETVIWVGAGACPAIAVFW